MFGGVGLMIWTLGFFVAKISFVCDAKKVDNKLIGSPEVICGPDAIRIRGESEDIFEGQVFVKNQRRSHDCFVVYSADDNSTAPEFTLSLNRISSCGIDMRRNPTRGLELFAVFVFAFHPSFVTAGDRAFAVHCLFQQQQITISTRFDFISDITPKAVVGATSSVPAVELEIVHGRVPTEKEVTDSVRVGEPLMLIWHTESNSLNRSSRRRWSRVISRSAVTIVPDPPNSTLNVRNAVVRRLRQDNGFGTPSTPVISAEVILNENQYVVSTKTWRITCPGKISTKSSSTSPTWADLYGVRVLDCTAETRDRRGMGIIRDGCSTDNTLISDIRYADNHQRAFADATAFKFPDLTEVWFRCAVQLCIRRFDHLVLTGKSEQDLCNNSSKCGTNPRQRRRVVSDADDNVIEVTGRVFVNDDESTVYTNYAAQASAAPSKPSTVCMTKDVMAVGSAVSATVCVSSLLTIASFIYSKLKLKRPAL